ncbi:MAG: hypothetical protein P4M11_02465 [Candidatus Pacebacteria bacterium]|nr:hypothetical protein [Candidatus Paceibacterota bacterium]
MKIQLSRSNVLAIEMTELALDRCLGPGHRMVEINLWKFNVLGLRERTKIAVTGRVLLDDGEHKFAGEMVLVTHSTGSHWLPEHLSLEVDFPDRVLLTDHTCAFDSDDPVRRRIFIPEPKISS